MSDLPTCAFLGCEANADFLVADAHTGETLACRVHVGELAITTDISHLFPLTIGVRSVMRSAIVEAVGKATGSDRMSSFSMFESTSAP